MTFYDVNAGNGRSVFAAALLHDFRKLHGIEAMGSAYNTAMQTLFKAMKAKDVYTKVLEHIRSCVVRDWSFSCNSRDTCHADAACRLYSG